ncbi:hypothetical protein D915_006103 [Fasciola hepatica]|uniref:Arrestin C-terminal-like domain-containing protein n=1 Tax=Fasciola hepatica TaxID=6192 RepID=A0A4E0R702_FASHE|nr:hypothetical protein D915_006103 [Fasciola hepatica]
MAINPGDSRLPRYREGTAVPVFRKQSPSQAVCLYLTNRDFWSNLLEVYERKQQTGSEVTLPPECGAPPLPDATKDFEPAHHGIIEGVVHINPWLIDIGSFVYVEVVARYRYARSELDQFDCEVNEVVFRRRRQINPPRNYQKEGAKLLRNPPSDLKSYSLRTRRLYEKLGGPVSGQAMIDENLTAAGVMLGDGNNSRRNRTFVPQTKATQSSGHPNHPFVTFNFPFRFDINGTPDSVYLRGCPRPGPDGGPPPPGRMELFYQAVFGFAHHDSDSDPDPPSDFEDSDEEETPKIRHPGDPIPVKKTQTSKAKKQFQSEKDLFHKDAYPWRPRPKRAPRDGVSWIVRVYIVPSPSAQPKSEHIAAMKIRKLSYIPSVVAIEHMDPPTSHIDYCLSVGPRTGFDAGVITLLAKLDRVLYTPGQPIQCDIKLHNSSARIIHRIIVEVHQCLRVKACAGRVWRSFICRRCLTDNSLISGMPVLPGTENSTIRVTLNPWPTEASIRQAIKVPRGPIRPSGLANIEESWALRLPQIPGQEFALQTPPRHNQVPPRQIQRRALACSSFSGVLDQALSIEDQISVMRPLDEPVDFWKDIWSGNPHRNCRCVHHKRRPGEPERSDWMPPEEPYQRSIDCADVHPQDDDVNVRRAKQNLLTPLCQKCFGYSILSQYPVHISYEVVVQAELLPQHQPNPLGCESALRKVGLGSGLLIDPDGTIIGPDGPRVTLPCLLGHKQPHPEERIPLANFHIDQRQDCKDHVPGTSSDVLPPTDSSVSHMNPSSPTFLSLSRPLSSIDELHSTCSYNQFHQPSSSSKPDQIIITSENDGRLDHVYQIASDPTTPDATSLNRELTRSDSQTSHTKSSASSSDSPIVFSPLPGKPPEPPFCDNHLSEEQTISMKAEQNVQQYAVYVAAMIDVLSQRIMNQITEDDLDRRLQRLEVEAVASLGGTGDTGTNASATSTDVRKFDQVIPSPESIRNSDAASVHLARRSAPESDYRKSSLLTESHTIERVLLAQVRRLERRKKLDIKIDLLNHLPRHTQYTTFEADMLRLLGRQPSWHHIAILYYLARCTVRHVLKMHLAELNTLQRATGNELPDESARLRSFSSAAMLVELNQVERKFSSVSSNLTKDKQTQESMIAEIGRCRAQVERVKDFTMTFFTRWYADWVSKHGGWRSLIEDTEDSELD